MKKMICLVFFLFSGVVNAEVIDFESLTNNGTTFTDVSSPYQEDGFSILLGSYESPHLQNSNFYAGSTALFKNFNNGVSLLINSSNEIFNLVSIDLSELDATRLGPTLVTFNGFILGGASITQTFALDSIFGFETFVFSGFNNLTSVRWTQTAQFHQFDNIVVDLVSVPEPMIMAVLILGLIGMRLARTNKMLGRNL